MLYLGIDQHARQITISLRDENGDVLQARQVSTQPTKINQFFETLTRDRLRDDESFIAVLEVCGFNDWLIHILQDYWCKNVASPVSFSESSGVRRLLSKFANLMRKSSKDTCPSSLKSPSPNRTQICGADQSTLSSPPGLHTLIPRRFSRINTCWQRPDGSRRRSESLYSWLVSRLRSD